MFCGKCGAKLEEGVTFCPQCGTPTGAAPTAETAGTAPAAKKPNLPVLVGAVVLVAVIVVSLLFAVGPLGGRSAEKTIDQLFESVLNADTRGLMSLVPDGMVEAAMEESDMDEDEYEEQLDDMDEQLESSLSMMEALAGEDWTMTHEIVSTENITGEDLADLKDDYEEYNVKISAAKKLKLHITLLDSEGEEVDDSSTEMYVVKCGRDWCLDVNSMGNIF